MINQLRENLASFQSVLGFNPLEVEQGSYPWLKMRLGVISASKCKDMMAKKGTATRNNYMMQLIAEVITGIPTELGPFKQLEWGKENEPSARTAYSFMTGDVVHEIPFIYADQSMRCGISPDGIVNDAGLEIKCPFTSMVHCDTLVNDAIKDDYFLQMQFSMFVTGAQYWEFMSYDPRMPAHLMTKIIKVNRCDKTQEKIAESVREFITDMDRALEQLGVKFGQQWSTEFNFTEQQLHEDEEF
ncbi:lambda exonuclease family protein [Shewanella sp.]|uniref:lambda exonuclease family protein n=1 Tax=Shewanella sp. TaxID=50422 RepID=UPI001B782E11|nr:lambda exonuclease family protein [Shewanella sp.]MBP6517916.1 YqaJ viral recombinase family protein [Shewanella sp.]